jgi:polyhydroxyalkanoate synthesis regulator phasin
VAVLSGVAQAAGPGGAGKGFDPARYETVLAQKLGVSVEVLKNAQTAARNQVIDEAVTAGNLTQEQADRLKNAQPGQLRERIAPAAGAILRGVHNVFASAAKALGMTEQELMTEVRSGKSLAQVAQAKNVSRDQLKATILSNARTELDKAVGEGKLTSEQANTIYNGLSERIDQVIDSTGGGRRFMSRFMNGPRPIRDRTP